MPEPSENWGTVGTIVGFIIFGAVVTFQRLYSGARGDEKTRADRSPEIAVNAVGAAFVDRQASQSLVTIESDVHGMLKIMQDKAGQEHDDRLAKRVLEQIEANRKASP